jgi:hypothetical protein
MGFFAARRSIVGFRWLFCCSAAPLKTSDPAAIVTIQAVRKAILIFGGPAILP